MTTFPGVHISEGGPPPAIEGVPTGVPVFIGYTETAADPADGAAAHLRPIEIRSILDYTARFGGRFRQRYGAVRAPVPGDYDFAATDAQNVLHTWLLAPADPAFNLWAALKLFYANGGGRCFVVSVGNYWGGRDTPPDRTKPPVAVTKNRLLDGLAITRDLIGPSMLAIPDACLLADPADYGAVTVAQLEQAGTLRDRVAILDLHRATDPATYSTKGLAALRDAFYGHVAPAGANLAFGTAYAPALHTTLLAAHEVDYTDLQGSPATSATLNMLLLANCNYVYAVDAVKRAQVTAKIEQAFPAAPPVPPLTPQQVQALNQDLVATLPLLQQIETVLLGKLNVAPPSGIIAGIWTANDAAHGVWKAPANIACASVTAPVVKLADADQGAYNTPLNGIAIDLIRAFPSMGVLVWGARTLAGNSDDWRYVPVRRTGVFIEQSIRLALAPFAFEPNNAVTWGAVTAMISNFLFDVWRQGGLIGTKPSDAFNVMCGMGQTMTGTDLLNGVMNVVVQISLVRPAEFIVLQIQQKMSTPSA